MPPTPEFVESLRRRGRIETWQLGRRTWHLVRLRGGDYAALATVVPLPALTEIEAAATPMPQSMVSYFAPLSRDNDVDRLVFLEWLGHTSKPRVLLNRGGPVFQKHIVESAARFFDSDTIRIGVAEMMRAVAIDGAREGVFVRALVMPMDTPPEYISADFPCFTDWTRPPGWLDLDAALARADFG